MRVDSVYEIFQSMLEDMYQVEVSQGLISNVTDAISQDVKLWQNRPLDEVYAIVYLGFAEKSKNRAKNA